jgi:hypothetical protein
MESLAKPKIAGISSKKAEKMPFLEQVRCFPALY